METAFEHEPLNAVFCGFVSISRGHRGSFRPTRAGQSDLLDFQTLENADLRKMDLHVEHPKIVCVDQWMQRFYKKDALKLNSDTN